MPEVGQIASRAEDASGTAPSAWSGTAPAGLPGYSAADDSTQGSPSRSGHRTPPLAERLLGPEDTHDSGGPTGPAAATNRLNQRPARPGRHHRPEIHTPKGGPKTRRASTLTLLDERRATRGHDRR